VGATAPSSTAVVARGAGSPPSPARRRFGVGRWWGLPGSWSAIVAASRSCRYPTGWRRFGRGGLICCRSGGGGGTALQTISSLFSCSDYGTVCYLSGSTSGFADSFPTIRSIKPITTQATCDRCSLLSRTPATGRFSASLKLAARSASTSFLRLLAARKYGFVWSLLWRGSHFSPGNGTSGRWKLF